MHTHLVRLAFVAIGAFAILACGGEQTIKDPPGTTGGTTGGTKGGTSGGNTGGVTGGTTGGCTPNCGGKECGPDGCGGFCGICGRGTSCNPQGQCAQVECAPKCTGKQCGPDGCGGFCGICPAGQSCNGAGTCTDGGGSGCLPKCDGKTCGPDGCGNLCGKCGAGEVCNDEAGSCTLPTSSCGTIDEVGECQQENTVAVSCKAGKLLAVVCNPDKQLVCGYNPVKNKYDCIKPGCTPNCTGKECGSDGCGGGCGQCKPTETCNSNGVCTLGDVCVASCQGKVCGPDGCGGQCGICGGDDTCVDGECLDPTGPCDPDCAGKQCGSDGCGGSCGTCQATETCSAGKCSSSSCSPSCVGKSCGGDGCGGDCGTCPDSQTCDSAGHCLTPGDCGNLTYEGACQDETTVTWCASGTVMTQDCKSYGDDHVCAWIESQETYWCQTKCQAACATKECGDNGCGETCGECDSGKVCNGIGKCVPAGGGGECGDISYQGVCEGTTLKWCDSAGTLHTSNCGQYGKVCAWLPEFEFNGCKVGDCTPNCFIAGGDPDNPEVKQCGDDGCGNQCGVCALDKTCQAGKCAVGGGSDCGDVDLAGTCEGDVLKFCAGGSLLTQDCATTDKTCGFDPEGGTSGWYACLDKPPATDCGFLTPKGICVGQMLFWCTAAGNEDQLDCGEYDLFCLYSAESNGGDGGYDCFGDPGCIGTCPADQRCQKDGTCGCDGITVGGQCEGTTLVYCLGEKLKIEDCSADGKTCTYTSPTFADCLE